MAKEEKEKRKKSWAEKHPQAASLLKVLGGVGVLAGGGALAHQYMTRKDRAAATAIGQELADLTSKVKPAKAGEISKAVTDMVDDKKSVTFRLKDLIAQKLGTDSDKAGEYLKQVAEAREKAKDKLMSKGTDAIPELVDITKDHKDWRKDIMFPLRYVISKDTLKKIGPNARHRKGTLNPKGLIWQGEFDDTKKMFDGMGPLDRDLNGLSPLYPASSKWKNLLTNEAVVGHEVSHIPNLDMGADASPARRILQNIFDKARISMTYPKMAPAEALQALSSAKHRIIAQHGGNYNLTDAEWKEGFKKLMSQDAGTLEQLRLQNYLTPESIYERSRTGGKMNTINEMSDALLKRDENGVNLLDQLAARAPIDDAMSKIATLAQQYGLAQ